MLTADTVTDAQIEALRSSLPRNHYAWQSTVDALVPSPSHPSRRRNARAMCADILNDRARQGAK